MSRSKFPADFDSYLSRGLLDDPPTDRNIFDEDLFLRRLYRDASRFGRPPFTPDPYEPTHLRRARIRYLRNFGEIEEILVMGLREIEHEISMRESALTILYISDLAQLSQGNAVEFIGVLRRLLSSVGGDTDYLTFLFRMGSFSSFTTIPGAFHVHKLPHTHGLSISYGIQLLYDPWIDRYRSRSTGRPTFKYFAIYHQADMHGKRLFTIVMEDESLLHEKPISTEPRTRTPSTDYEETYYSSFRVNLAFCMTSTLSWAEFFDDYDSTIEAIRAHLSGHALEERESTTDMWNELLHWVQSLQEACRVIAMNHETLQQLSDAYKAFALTDGIKERSENGDFALLIHELASYTKRARLLITIGQALAETARSRILIESAVQSATLLTQSAALSLDTVKMEFISQNYSRGSAILAILFLPGIFVSTLLSSGFVGPTTSTATFVTLWLAITLPLTAVAIVVLRLLWRAPIANERRKQDGWMAGFWTLFPSLETFLRPPRPAPNSA